MRRVGRAVKSADEERSVLFQQSLYFVSMGGGPVRHTAATAAQVVAGSVRSRLNAEGEGNPVVVPRTGWGAGDVRRFRHGMLSWKNEDRWYSGQGVALIATGRSGTKQNLKRPCLLVERKRALLSAAPHLVLRWKYTRLGDLSDALWYTWCQRCPF